MLVARTLLFLFFQAVVAGLYWLGRAPAAWEASAAWWPVTATLTNLAVIGLLVRLYRAEGRRYREIFRLNRQTLLSDLLALAGVLVIGLPLAALPNTLLATWLWGDPQAPLALLLHPLPRWAALLSLLIFPLSIALAELPAYFAYAMPRLEAQTGSKVLAVGLSSLALAAQHGALPFLPDGRFLIWRLLMFVPFALVVGLALHWRPRLLPYLVVIHGLMDFSLMLMLPGILS